MKPLVVCFFLLLSCCGYTQTTVLCRDKLSLNQLKSIEMGKPDCRPEQNENAYKRISELMKFTGIPMKFNVCKVEKLGNAKATVNSDGARFIYYDDAFLKKLDTDSLRLQTVTVLAHEIGHHLSAHTLFLINDNYDKQKSKYCDLKSSEYDEKRCREEELKYYSESRKQELEADRFAGFLMFKFGASLSDVKQAYFKFSSNYDDTESTHPSLNKRLDAVQAGYELAETKAKSSLTNFDIEQIKGNRIDFALADTTNIKRNQLLDRIYITITHDAIRHIDDGSKLWIIPMLNAFPDDETIHGIRTYLGRKNMAWLIDSTNEYFRVYNVGIQLHDDPKVNSQPITAIHIKDGQMKLLLFEGLKPPKVLYSSPFREGDMSLAALRTTFIELYSKSLQKVIEKLNEKR